MSHRIRFRVYYEDTDAGGIVYYANYLRFAERARTEWMRSFGYAGSAFAHDLGLAFVVRKVEADYHRPARLDTLLDVHSELVWLRRTSMLLTQTIADAATPHICICNLRVLVVCVSTSTLKPHPIPDSIVKKITLQTRGTLKIDA